MKLEFSGKRSEDEYLSQAACQISPNITSVVNSSLLLQGNNANIMRALLQHHGLSGAVDLVYIDPPFATNTIFRVGSERTSTMSAQLTDSIAYRDTLQGEQFLEYIRERLILLRELMSDRGSIYLHIDYKVGHYIKIIMDEVFGAENFRNDITRIKCNPKNFSRKGYGNIKDMVLFYTKTKNYIWNEPRIPMQDADIVKRYSKIDSQGRRYTTVPVHAPGETVGGATSKLWRGMQPPKGRHWRCSPLELDQLDAMGLIEWSKTGNPRRKNYAEDAIKRGKKLQDVWEFKDTSYPLYPTQKNLEMLLTIISTSSSEASVVMDCFCGSGTSLVAAEMLGRKWVGIDQSQPAIDVTKRRLQELDMFAEKYIERKYPY